VAGNAGKSASKIMGGPPLAGKFAHLKFASGLKYQAKLSTFAQPFTG